MINKFVVVSFATIFSFNLYSAEPSAFGAGDLDSSQPYGLSASEQVVLKNKNEIKSIATQTKNQMFQIDSLQERIDGLQSVVENLTRTSYQNKIDLKHLNTKFLDDINSSQEYKRRLTNLIESNLKQIEETKLTLEQLDKIVKNIEMSFVSKDEFNSLVNDFNKFKTLLKKELKTKNISKNTQRTNWQILTDAKANFNKKFYTKSIKDFEYLISKNFKSAFSHYMIGEMNYRRKNYANAIAYFKKSADIYSKAEYMPTLMLHTAISMQETGDTEKAEIFYNAIMSSYPNTKEANIASKNLETIR